MRKLILFLTLGFSLRAQYSPSASGSSIAAAEINSKPAIRSGAGAPSANCTAAKDFYVDTTNFVLYFCGASNTWYAALTGIVPEANGGTGANNTVGAAGHVLRSNGTHYVDSAIQAGDVPTLNQSTTGNAGNVTGIVAEANGGTGANNTTGAAGHYLRSNGTHYVDNSIQAADVPTLNQSTTGNAANVTGIVAEANGGTGANNTPGAAGHVLRSNATHYVDAALACGDLSNSAASCSTDATNAANITSGTLPNARIVALPNANLANSATTVNGQTCTLGSTCTVPLSAVNPQTATYQVLAADFSNYKTITVASGTFTITLVASGSQPANGQYIQIINYGSGVVTVARSGQNINGAAANLTLASASASSPSAIYVISDGTNYFAHTTGVQGSPNLTTVDAIPFVSAAGTLNQDASLNMQPTTTPIPEGGVLIGQGSQQYLISGRGTDSGASQGVPYFRSATAQSGTAFDVFPNGSPVPGANGNAWYDVCSNDLQALNSSDWNCATLGAAGYVFGISNGSLVSIVVSSNVATATTLTAHNLVSPNPFTVVGGPSGLAGAYTVASAPTSTTFTFTTSGVANGTYTNTGMSISTPGTVYVGAHTSSASLAQSSMVLAGTTINFQDRIGNGATVVRGIWTGSELQLGSTPTFKWYFNSGSQRMGSTVFERWSNSSDPDGTADLSISRISAGVLGIGGGTTGTVTGALKASAVIGGGSVPTISGCSAGTQVGGNTAGSYASGTTGTCTVTLTFATTAPNGWACSPHDLTTPADVIGQTATTTTTATLSGTTVSGDVVNFSCVAY